MATIELTQGKQALVDDEDLERVATKKWHYTQGYARNSQYLGGGRKNLKVRGTLLHRFIMNAQDGLDVDHINHDTLDNRKSNLRVCERVGNARNRLMASTNSTGYKGVNHYGARFRAQIYLNGKNKHLGLFDKANDAARAYNKAAKEYFGQFAYLNKLEKI